MSAERIFVALLHWPVRNKEGRIIATALTTIDIHDFARLGRTFGLGGVYIVTPILTQLELGQRIVHYWTEGPGAQHNPLRKVALEKVRFSLSLEEVLEDFKGQLGVVPKMVATSARNFPNSISYVELRKEIERGGYYLILFGTGWGLSDELILQADYRLEPIEGKGYNHLSVRTAAAIIIDRLVGRW